MHACWLAWCPCLQEHSLNGKTVTCCLMNFNSNLFAYRNGLVARYSTATESFRFKTANIFYHSDSTVWRNRRDTKSSCYFPLIMSNMCLICQMILVASHSTAVLPECIVFHAVLPLPQPDSALPFQVWSKTSFPDKTVITHSILTVNKISSLQ